MIIIPARLKSYRLPNKMLLPIDGKPMLSHVIDKCVLANSDGKLGQIIVATEDQRIIDEIKRDDCEFILTGTAENGTARVYEAAKNLVVHKSEPIVNVQGDHPFISPKLIKQVHEMLSKILPYERHNTMVAMMEDKPEGVRVLVNPSGNAQTFTRTPVPGSYSHCGIYGYHYSFLEHYIAWENKNWEQGESLEQMRVLENGANIRMGLAEESAGPSIDFPEDYNKYTCS